MVDRLHPPWRLPHGSMVISRPPPRGKASRDDESLPRRPAALCAPALAARVAGLYFLAERRCHGRPMRRNAQRVVPAPTSAAFVSHPTRPGTVGQRTAPASTRERGIMQQCAQRQRRRQHLARTALRRHKPAALTEAARGWAQGKRRLADRTGGTKPAGGDGCTGAHEEQGAMIKRWMIAKHYTSLHTSSHR